MSTMSTRQWILSAMFALMIALKISEAAFATARWPISNVSMFSGVRPKQLVPFRPRLQAVRGDQTITLGHSDFLISKDEFAARLVPFEGIERRCGTLISLFDRAAGGAPSTAGWIVYEPVFRPGLWSDAKSWNVRCMIPPPQEQSR
jgi:hypothetical protein